MSHARRAALAAALLLPGGLVVYTAFNGGGFFAGTQGWLAVGFALLLAARVTVADDPFAGASRTLAGAVGALALLAGWVLLSAQWSDAPARALLEFDRVLLYVLAAVFFGTLPMTRGRLRVALLALAAAAVAVCTVSLITRALPELWPVAENISNERLAYPITYWNALGLLAVYGILLCLHFTCSEREPGWARAAAAASLPVLCATLYLTLSRGAILVGALSAVAYLALARPRGAWGGLAAVLPACAVAVAVTYGADVLASERPATPEGVDQGRVVAVAVAACAVGAAALRLALLRLDAWVVSRPPLRVSRRALALAAAGATAVAAVALAAAGAPGYVERQFDTFVERAEPLDDERGDRRGRLTDPSSNGRVDEWAAAIEGFSADRLQGSGAGTFSILWSRHRPDRSIAVDAHSLYAETLGELGLVGLALVLALVLVLLAGAAARIRGPDRALYAAVLAVIGAWALRAGIDWDWEMPVVTLPALALGAAALATPRALARSGADPGSAEADRSAEAGPSAETGPSAEPDPAPRGWHPPQLARLIVGLGCLFLALTPLRVARSQGHLNAAVRAYDRDDCPAAVEEALDSLDDVAIRPEPRVVLAYCDLRLGQEALALRQVDRAVARDPDDWSLRYVQAVVRARVGRDPRPGLALAARLNPNDELVKETIEDFASARTPAQWTRRAVRTALPGI